MGIELVQARVRSKPDHRPKLLIWVSTIVILFMCVTLVQTSNALAAGAEEAPEADAFVGRAVYFINASTGRYMDADSNRGVNQSLLAGSDDRWLVRRTKSGSLTVTHVDSGQLLVAHNEADGYNVDLNSTRDASDQWRLDPKTEGVFEVSNLEFDRRLHAKGAAGRYNVDLASDAEAPERDNQWYLSYADDAELDGSIVMLRNRGTREFLGVNELGYVSLSTTPGADQQWIVDVDEQGVSQLRHIGSDKLLGANSSDYDKIDLTWGEDPDNDWTLTEFPRSTHTLKFRDQWLAAGSSDGGLDLTDKERPAKSRWKILVLREDSSAPTAPGANVSRVTDTMASFTWSEAVDDVRVAGYRIYRDGVAVEDLAPSTSDFAFRNLKADTTYDISIGAYDAAGNESVTDLVVTTKGNEPTFSARAVAATVSSFTVKWNPPTNDELVAGYRVLQDGVPIATVDRSRLRTDITSLSAGTTYDIEVEAVDAENQTLASTSVSAATEATAPDHTIRVIYFVPTDAESTRGAIMRDAVVDIQEQWSNWGWTFYLEPSYTTINATNNCAAYRPTLANLETSWDDIFELIRTEVRENIGSYATQKYIIMAECAELENALARAEMPGSININAAYVVNGIAAGSDPDIGIIGHELGHNFGLAHERCRLFRPLDESEAQTLRYQGGDPDTVTAGPMCAVGYNDNRGWPNVYPLPYQNRVVCKYGAAWLRDDEC